MHIHRTYRLTLNINSKCTQSCPYYMPIEMQIPEKDKGKCPITDDGEGRCWYNADKLKRKCECNTPELGVLYRNFDGIGICKNCGHFIIKKKTWMHYNRPYNCRFPYESNDCQSPYGYNDIPIKNKSKIKDPYDLLMENMGNK